MQVEPPPPPTKKSKLSKPAIVVIGCVLGCVLLLSVVVLLEVRNKRTHKDLLGRVKPPAIGPETTILVAAIQDFDDLWQVVVDDASERALVLLQEAAERLLRKHSGYQTPSDDELVVAAFHNPRDAAEFAIDFQRELLVLPWPRSILEMDQFKPVYFAPT